MTPIDSPTPAKASRPTAGVLVLRLAIYLLLGGYFLLGLGYLALRYHVWPNLDHWRPEIVAQISQMLRRPVTIAQISTGFDGLQPVLVVRDLRLAAASGAGGSPMPSGAPSPSGATPSSDSATPVPAEAPLFAIEEARAVVALRTFVTARLRLAELELVRPRITIERAADGGLSVAGVALSATDTRDGGVLEELLAQRELKARAATIDWIDAKLGQSQRIEGVDIDLHNVGRRHKVEVRSTRAGTVARAFEATAELFRQPGRKAVDWNQWHGDLYASAEGLASDALAALIGASPPFRGAQGEVKLWARLDDRQLNDIQVKLSAQQLRIDLPQDDALAIDRFTAEGSAVRRKAGGFDIVVRRLAGQTESGFALRASGDQSLSVGSGGELLMGRLAIEDVDVAGALVVLRKLPLPAEFRALLAPTLARGRLSDINARFDRRDRLEFDAGLRFERLSLQLPAAGAESPAVGDALAAAAAARPAEGRPAEAPAADEPPRLGIPSFENLSGSARLTHAGGQMSFEGRQSALAFPGLFEEPRIALDQVQGKVNWSAAASGAGPVKLTIEQLTFANADAAGQVSGTFESAGGGPGIVDLKGGLSRGDARRVARYLPVYLPSRVRGWVAESITGGQISQTRFALRGNLLAFPFRNPEDGEFHIEGKVGQGTLAYAPDWPKIEQFDGTLRFTGTGMDIRMNQGRLFGVGLNDVHARIAEFRRPNLTIDGQGHGPARDLLRFVNESPLRTRIDDFTKDTVVTGDAGLQVRLDLPLDDLKSSRVAGKVIFEKNDLTLDPTIPKFEDVAGQLHFGDEGLALTDLSAVFLGGPLKVDGTTPEQGRFLINATGSLSAENIRAVVDNPLTQKLSGRAQYRASIDVFKRASRLTVESDLVGLAADLPEPFNKRAADAWPLHSQTRPTGSSGPGERGSGDLIETTIHDKVRLVFERGRHPQTQKLQIRRGAFAYDAPATLADQGFVVLVNRSDIDIDRWLDLLTSPSMQAAAARSSDEFAAGFTMLPSLVSLVSDRITIGGKALNDVVFGASRQGGRWRANISAREINGYFNWSEAREGQRIGALTARFSRLEIPGSQRSEVESLLETAPRELPALDIWADEFVLSDRSLGRLSLQATTGGTEAAPVWHLNSLRIENPAAVLQASGLWAAARPDEARRTRLDYRLDILDSGELLARYGMKNVVRAGTGSLSGSLGWEGSPLALHYESLGGNIDVSIGKGQFLKTEPGIAKLIGVLNLQFLPRRLSLDFSDVFAEGFSFDEIEGQASIVRGIAHTDELRIKGVQAQVRMKGDVDLARERQNVEVEVRPELNAGLASLAYAALANPAVGLTTFIAQALLRKPLEDIFTYTYDVSGTWADPQVSERRRAPVLRPAPTP